MSKYKTGIMISSDMGIPEPEQLRLVADAGFDAFFTPWKNPSHVASLKELTDSLGLIYHSVHAPFDGDVFLTHLWESGDKANSVIRELSHILEVCSENGIGILVTHVHSGFEYELPTLNGIGCAAENFGIIANRAHELGVKLALENIENFELNEALMSALAAHPAVGFCWDSGHECCYYSGHDLMSDFGDKIIAVHLHDNMGCGDESGRIASRDDLHMLPFDGIIDWQNVAKRLDMHRYDGVMMLEVKRKVWYSDRTENAHYAAMPPNEYITAAFERIKKLNGFRK